LIAYQNFNEASSTKGIINLLSQGNNMIYYQPQSYIIIRYKVVCAEFLGSVFSSKLSMVLINDSPYRREAPSYS